MQSYPLPSPLPPICTCMRCITAFRLALGTLSFSPTSCEGQQHHHMLKHSGGFSAGCLIKLRTIQPSQYALHATMPRVVTKLTPHPLPLPLASLLKKPSLPCQLLPTVWVQGCMWTTIYMNYICVHYIYTIYTYNLVLSSAVDCVITCRSHALQLASVSSPSRPMSPTSSSLLLTLAKHFCAVSSWHCQLNWLEEIPNG